MTIRVLEIIDGYTETFEFEDEAEHLRWVEEMGVIRTTSVALGSERIGEWLQQVAVSVGTWGVGRMPHDIKMATNCTEDAYAAMGNFLKPLFRPAVSPLHSARLELIHAEKTSTFKHFYTARSGETQIGEGVPKKHMVGFKRNKLKSTEFKYLQLDGTTYTLRTTNIDAGLGWRNFVIQTWRALAEICDLNEGPDKERHYELVLQSLHSAIRGRGHVYVPPCMHPVVHALQDRFGEPRIEFPAVLLG